MIQCEQVNKFEKELKKLTKKYKSLPEDLKTFKKVISKLGAKTIL